MRYLWLVLTLAACGPMVNQGLRFAPANSSRERGLQTVLTELLAHSEPYAAPDEYGQWWNDVLGVCDCRPRVQLYDLQWRKMIGSAPRERGAFWGGINIMFILSGDAHNEKVIRHEMLHAMLGGDPEHRQKAWKRL